MLQYKYNPQNASPEELKATFTARDTDVRFNSRRVKKLSQSNQHYLILGPRGIGKTNLLRMIYLNKR